MKKTKGITLIETIVAMAVAVVMSVAVYATCNFAILATAKNRTKSFFANETQNYVNCYFLGENQFADGIKLLTNQDVIFGQDMTIYYDEKYQKTSEDKSIYHVDLKFETNKFQVKCFENANQNLIFEVEV